MPVPLRVAEEEHFEEPVGQESGEELTYFGDHDGPTDSSDIAHDIGVYAFVFGP